MGLTENAERENAGHASRFTTKCERVVKIFMSLAKYYYNYKNKTGISFS